MANDFYDHMTFCARAFRIDEEEQLSEEECFLTMVGTPIRSVRRHEQSMRLTLYVTNFLNNLRAELTTYDEEEAEEDVRRALGVAFTLWRLSLSDFEDRQFGCFSLNLIAFEAIVNNVERIQELIELAAEKENDDRVMPHLADAGQARAKREEEEETEDDEGKETLAVIDSIAFVDAEELAGEEFE